MNRHLVIVALLLTVSAACVSSPDVPVVMERYLTRADTAMNTDSVASYTAGNDEIWLFATAKDAHLVEIFDAATGEHLRNLGGPGAGPGEFQRPNGILVRDGLLIVIERDNHRVQLFRLPSLDFLTSFGDAELIKPYGAWLQADAPGDYRLYVTDAYETGTPDHRVQIFDLGVERDARGVPTAVRATHERGFGATQGPGVLRVVESIWGDARHDRLLIAEEDPAGGRVIKVYSLDGRFTGSVIGEGIFRTQPEGIALYQCPDGGGYWITTDQARRRNVFHVFDRRTLAYVGGFSGAVTRNTDGIWLNQTPLPGFPDGALFAVHDDQAVAAFDWRDIAAALERPARCG